MPLNDDKNRSVMFGVTTIIAAVIIALLVWFSTSTQTPPSEIPPATEDAMTAVNPNPETAAAQIGTGNYTLTDTNGQTVTQDSYPDKFKLVFFGYTNCPDICPMTLQKLVRASSQLGPDADRVQTVFITVDPARDTAEQLKGYLANFSPTIVGLTGTPDQIKQVADAYRTYYSPSATTQPAADHTEHAAPTADDKMNTANPTDAAATATPAAGMVDHSSFVYLMSPSNQLVSVIDDKQSAEEIAQTIKTAMAAPQNSQGTTDMPEDSTVTPAQNVEDGAVPAPDTAALTTPAEAPAQPAPANQ